MKIITHEFIIERLKSTRAISALSLFALSGFVIPFIPFWVLGGVNTNALISFAFLFLIFGFPFGYLIGLKNIIKTSKIRNDIENKRFSVLVDEIVDTRVSKNGRSSEMDDNFCELYLRRYSEEKGRTVTVRSAEFRKLAIGDQCILIFAESEKRPVLVFAGNNYCIDENLKNRLI